LITGCGDKNLPRVGVCDRYFTLTRSLYESLNKTLLLFVTEVMKSIGYSGNSQKNIVPRACHLVK